MSTETTAESLRLDRALCLVIPTGTDLTSLARAWFTEAEWVREPPQLARVPEPTGSRFRGGPRTAPPVAPGEFRLSWSTSLIGPIPRDTLPPEISGDLAAAAQLVFRVQQAPEAPPEPRVDGWLLAAARRTGGSVVAPDGSVTSPDPDSAVELSVYSPIPLAPEMALSLVRSVATQAALESVPLPEEGIAPYSVLVPTEYDGTVEIGFVRASELPLCLLQLDWRDYGPLRYRARWLQSADIGVGADDSWVRIARRRVAPIMARGIAAIARAATGVVVDEDGFVVPPERLAARASAF